ncbi:MAG: hypothetical protein E6R03_05095 [Hyphomicrobiaceae bacterium]|nr:MAG: hypothetical protein E6R03_05095 [Hyphomicrobiaceae bacterium]
MKLVEEFDLAPDDKGRTSWQFSFNHAAMRELERLTGGIPAWTTLTEDRETHTRIIHLAWAGSISFRIQALRKPDLTLDQFEELIPEYLSDEWFRFQDFINSLVLKTFPRAAGTRIELQTLRALQTIAALATVHERLIGTTDSGPPSNSSECLQSSSGTTGTG